MQKLEVLISDIFVGYEDNNNLENVVHKLCAEKKLSLSVAESCTGGKISEVITAVSGLPIFLKAVWLPIQLKQKKRSWIYLLLSLKNIPWSVLRLQKQWQ